MNICKICGEEKEEYEFPSRIRKETGQEYFEKMCKKCSAIKQKEYRKERRYDHKLEREYGITKAQWELILKSQDGKCKLCEREFDGRINVDHNHKTQVIRGLLCCKCNHGLGQFDDDPILLQKAKDYLETANALEELHA